MGPLLEPRRIRCRTWNRIMIVVATCRGGADLSIEVRPRLESGLRRSPGGTALMPKVEPGRSRADVEGGARLP